MEWSWMSIYTSHQSLLLSIYVYYVYILYIYIYLCLCLCTFILFLNLFIYYLHETDLEPWIVFVFLWLQSMGTTSANYPDMLSWFHPCSWSFLLLGSTYIDWNLWNHTKYCNLGCVQGKLASMVKHILEDSTVYMCVTCYLFVYLLIYLFLCLFICIYTISPPTFNQIYVVALHRR